MESGLAQRSVTPNGIGTTITIGIIIGGIRRRIGVGTNGAVTTGTTIGMTTTITETKK
jgi:hypothetical protein